MACSSALRPFATAFVIAIIAGFCFAGSTRAADAVQKKYLIVHADDAGMSHSVNMATIEAMEKGIVSSASIMVPCPWFVEFAEYAKKHPERDFGIHLTLNSEWKHYRWGPVAPRDQVKSLVDKEGFLWRDVPEVAINAKASEVETELRAQIKRAQQFGVKLSHLDTHMGALVSRPDLLEVYVNLGIEFDLPVMFTRAPDAATARLYPAIAKAAAPLIKTLEDHHFPLLEVLFRFNNGSTHEERKASYLEDFKHVKPGFNQIIIHCGFDNEELKAITGTSAKRDGDRRIFTDPEVIAAVKNQGIEVVSWQQCREMAAKK